METFMVCYGGVVGQPLCSKHINPARDAGQLWQLSCSSTSLTQGQFGDGDEAVLTVRWIDEDQAERVQTSKNGKNCPKILVAGLPVPRSKLLVKVLLTITHTWCSCKCKYAE